MKLLYWHYSILLWSFLIASLVYPVSACAIFCIKQLFHVYVCSAFSSYYLSKRKDVQGQAQNSEYNDRPVNDTDEGSGNSFAFRLLRKQNASS